MSASAQQSLAVADDTATAAPTPAPPAVVAPPTPAPENSQAAPAVRPCWRTTTAGYVLLVLATAFAWFIPHLHLHANIGEEALVLLDIAALVISTCLIVGGYFRSIIRKL
jgi:hypothetical protein